MNQFNPPEMLDQGDQKEHNFGWKCCCWFFQIVDLLSLLALIIVIIEFPKFTIKISIGFAIIHIIYILVEILSPTGKYICNKNSGQGIYENMGRYFRALPEIIFHGVCYHNEIIHYTKKDKLGIPHQYTKTKKVITYEPEEKMPYYSVRDVSGLFYLNCDKAIAIKKSFIKLKVKEEINFADPISIMDYQNEIDLFYANNRYKDKFFEFSEERKIPGLIHHNLIKMGENEPFLSKYFFFILSTFLALSEFYKLYFNSLCIFQRFKVRKLISTRYDLNQPLYQEKYQPLIPQINLMNKTYDYKPQEYNYLNNDYQLNLPTQEELEKAQMFKDKVPNYQVSSGNGQIHSGVIIDNPNYCDYRGKPYDQKPAPVQLAPIEVFQNNKQPLVSQVRIGENQNIQVNEIDNRDALTEDDRIISEQELPINRPPEAQIRAKVEKP